MYSAVYCMFLYSTANIFFYAVCLEFNILILPHSQVYFPIYRIYSIWPRDYNLKCSPQGVYMMKYCPLRKGNTKNQIFQFYLVSANVMNYHITSFCSTRILARWVYKSQLQCLVVFVGSGSHICSWFLMFSLTQQTKAKIINWIGIALFTDSRVP